MLELENVSRSFGDVRALEDVSFTVRPGRLTGFVGGNGAGKTTTMRIVLGVLAADGGQVRWNGTEPDAATRRRFGYMPEERGLYPKMKVREQLVFFGRLHGLSAADADARVMRLLEDLDLAEKAGSRLDTLSLGNQQRAQVAAALLHDPELLILDEPFSGLDPAAVDRMSTQLRARAASGVPVLFSSHQLDLVERICDDIVIIGGGRVLAAGEAAQMREDAAGARYRLTLGQDAGWLRDVPGLKVQDVDGPRAVVEVSDPEADADQRLLALALAHGPVREFARDVPTLSDIFREVVK